MNTILAELKEICLKYELTSLQRLIQSVDYLSVEKYIDISIFGQFKAGKSSFINSIIQKDILPTAVIPATSVITKIYYGDKEKASITLNDGGHIEIDIQQLDEYVTETKNPKNIKKVAIANIELPNLKEYKRFRLIDTPGIGSIHLNNSQTTEEWSPEATIVIICISAERPLSEFDLNLIKELQNYSYRIIILITKTDFFNEQQINEIKKFLSTSLYNEFHKEFEIYPYSILKDTEIHKNTLYKNIFQPLKNHYEQEIENITNHKLKNLAEHALNYLEMAYQASIRTEEEREQLKKRIFDEKVSIKYIRHELQLITTDAKSRIRNEIYQIFEPYISSIILQLQQHLNTEFPNWKGNLYKLTRTFEQWLKEELKITLKEIAEKENKQFAQILKEINQRYGFYAKSLRERLNDNIKNVLGISFSLDEWQPEYKPIKQPDISVYRVFDSHIDLLWFLFPMFIFKTIFKKHFYKQIPNEVEKNIHRLTSDIFEIIQKQIEQSKEETLKYIQNEIDSIENALSGKQNKSIEYDQTIQQLKQIIQTIK